MSSLSLEAKPATSIIHSSSCFTVQDAPSVAIAAGSAAVAGGAAAALNKDDPRAGAAFGLVHGFTWSFLNILSENLFKASDDPLTIIARVALPLIFATLAGAAIVAALGFQLSISSILLLSGASFLPLLALGIYSCGQSIYCTNHSPNFTGNKN